MVRNSHWPAPVIRSNFRASLPERSIRTASQHGDDWRELT
jgi:hypothetical protein